MPNYSVPQGQDWESVNVGRSHSGKVTVPKTAREISLAKEKGLITTEKR